MDKREKMFCFDLIRVLSTFLIVCCHFSVAFSQYNISGFSNYLLNFANSDSGKLGVYLFFMISGSTLIYNYQGDEFSILQFYKKRWIRIFPLFYLAWILFYFIKVMEVKNFLFNGSITRFRWTIMGIDYYVGGMYPTYAIVGEWFTGAIIVIYVIFPLLRLLYKHSLLYYITSIVLYILYLVNFFIFPLPHTTNVETVFVDIFYFWVGMVLIKERESLKNIPIYLLIIPLVPLLIVKNQYSITTNSLIISIIIYILCMRVYNGEVLESNIVFKFISKYSYAIYLTHHQIIYLVIKNFANGYLPIWKSFIIYCIIWLIIGSVSAFLTKLNTTLLNIFKYRFFGNSQENNFMKLG
ncbi:acyltransferase [uncultured Clostridium sp.]|uniref:acyltransferase n=1 Tax=uncultured Clostridium sp. TaxID=59620 RepID=UPI0028E4C81F|nr:acyltransferase [uncultured Clostridium sp.]